MLQLPKVLIVLLGYAAAVLATPFFVLAATMLGDLASGGVLPTGKDIFDFLVTGWMLTAMFSALPFLCAIGVMAKLRRYDWLAHSVAGGIVAYVAMSILNGRPVDPSGSFVPFLIGGLGAGTIYWLFRGRFGWPKI